MLNLCKYYLVRIFIFTIQKKLNNGLPTALLKKNIYFLKYKLYTIYMKKMHEYINGCLNIKVSNSIIEILKYDCRKFGYIKNDEPNISGFLNDLIPNLSLIREEKHEEFLKYNDWDPTITKIVEDNIYNIYLKSFDLEDNNMNNIYFRINKKNKNKFIEIEDILLAKYSIDFTNYIRSLLKEYSIKPFYKRELCIYYRHLSLIRSAVKNMQKIRIYLGNTILDAIPISLEVCASIEENYLVIIICELNVPYYYRLNDIYNISYLEEYVKLDSDAIKDAMDNFEKYVIRKEIDIY